MKKKTRSRTNGSVFVPEGKKNRWFLAAKDARGEVRIYESNSRAEIVKIAAVLKKGGMEILMGWGE